MKSSKIKWIVLLALGLVLVITAFSLRGSSLSSGWLWEVSNEGKWLLPLVAVSAMIDSLNPCAFSVLLLTVAFLFSIGHLRRGILKIGLVYVFAVFLIYLLIGLGIVQTFSFFNIPHFLTKLAASLIIIFGMINVINEFFPNFPIRLRIPLAAHNRIASYMEKATAGAAFTLGIFVGLVEFPCTGGPYLLVLGLLHDYSTYWRGFAYLLFYNLIFVLPLLIILLAASDNRVLEKIKTWQQKENRSMKLWSGVAMIILGVLIFLL